MTITAKMTKLLNFLDTKEGDGIGRAPRKSFWVFLLVQQVTSRRLVKLVSRSFKLSRNQNALSPEVSLNPVKINLAQIEP